MNILERETEAWFACAGHSQSEVNKPHLRIGRACPASEFALHDKNMSNKIDDGGPAFPVNAEIYNGTGLCGMTLRDWFAGQALQGYLAGRNNNLSENPSNFTAQKACRDCYAYADAMIAARNGGAK